MPTYKSGMSDSDIMDRYQRSCRTNFWQAIFRKEVDYLTSHLKGAKDILSVGCGPAIIENELSKKGFRITGMDVSREALNASPDSIRTVVGNAEEMPLPTSSFDAAIYVASLQFIGDYQKAIAEVNRVLRPNGKVIVLLLNPQSAFFQQRFRDPDSYVRQIRHKDLKAIEEAIEKDFTVRSEYYLGVQGDIVFDSSDVDKAALYVIVGTRRGTEGSRI